MYVKLIINYVHRFARASQAYALHCCLRIPVVRLAGAAIEGLCRRGMKAKTMEERRRRVVERAGCRETAGCGLLTADCCHTVWSRPWACPPRRRKAARRGGYGRNGPSELRGTRRQGKYGAGGAATGKRSFGKTAWRDTRQVVCATDCARSDARGDARNCAGGPHLAAPMTRHEQGQGTFRMAAHTDSGGVWV